ITARDTPRPTSVPSVLVNAEDRPPLPRRVAPARSAAFGHRRPGRGVQGAPLRTARALRGVQQGAEPAPDERAPEVQRFVERERAGPLAENAEVGSRRLAR